MSRSAFKLLPTEAVIGLDFGGSKTDIALADGAGSVLERVRLTMQPADDADGALRRAADAARAIAAQAADRHGRTVVAFAAVTPGLPIDTGVLLAPNLPGWEHLPFQRLLTEHLETTQLTVANDVRAGALAELRLGVLQDVDPGLYVSIGTGLAAALIAGGRVIGGAHGIAGEIGYTAVDLTSPPAPGRAPLEEVVGGRALGLTATDLLGEPLNAADLFTRADPEAVAIVERAMTTLAGALANLALLVDPARIALGGGLMADAERILPAIRERLISIDGNVPAPEVVTARFVQDASLHGSIMLALDAATRDRERLEPSTGARACR
jgi:glucokinase